MKKARALTALTTISVAAAWIMGGLATRVAAAPAWLISAPTVAGVFGVLYGFVDRYGWKVGWLRFLCGIETPSVAGTYAGQLVSDFDQTTVPVRLTIEQTWTELAVWFNVEPHKTSQSRSVAASLSAVSSDTAELTYTYKNEVMPIAADGDMSDHDGTATLLIARAGGLHGRYFNARGRRGEIEARRHIS